MVLKSFFKTGLLIYKMNCSVSQLVGRDPRDHSEWVAECAAKETTSTTKNVILNVFLMQDFYFKRRA